MNDRKILIISHNPINQFDNMGKTIGNIFIKFKPNELCQLYFKDQDIYSKNCEEFFCIDDISMCKSIINRRYKTGREMKNERVVNQMNHIQTNIFEYGRKRNGLIYLLRDFLWKIGKWKTNELKSWIEEKNITSIFLVAGDYIFPLNIALKISKKYNIPLFVYFVDEFYRKEIGKQTLLAKLHKLLYRKKFKQIINYSTKYFCISEAMKDFYSTQFEKEGEILMNTTDIINNGCVREEKHEKLIISYIGNLGYDRWKNIIDFANTICEQGLTDKVDFNIYTGEKNEKVLEHLKATKGLNFIGKIGSEKVKEVIHNSDILLHVENFNKLNMDKIKYSISTKIPDSLASGKLLMLYGPSVVESINYVMRNNAGIVVNNKTEIGEVLNKVLKNEINIDDILKNAQKLVEKNHRNSSIYDKLNRCLL